MGNIYIEPVVSRATSGVGPLKRDLVSILDIKDEFEDIIRMAIAVIILVRVVQAHPLLTWSTLAMMNNAHAMSVFYRLRTGKWKKIKLIE